MLTRELVLDPVLFVSIESVLLLKPLKLGHYRSSEGSEATLGVEQNGPLIIWPSRPMTTSRVTTVWALPFVVDSGSPAQFRGPVLAAVRQWIFDPVHFPRDMMAAVDGGALAGPGRLSLLEEL